MWSNRSVVVACAVVCMGVAMPVRAQRIGILAGGTFSELRGLDDATTSKRTGTMFGVSLTLPMVGNVAVQPELLFVNKGSKLTIGGVFSKDVRIDYLEIPLLLRFDRKLTSAIGPHFYLGPSLGYKVGFKAGCIETAVLSGGAQNSSVCADQTFKPKSFDWGAVVGAGVDMNVGGIGITTGVRYGGSLANISRDDSPALEQRVRNGALTVYAGVLFGKR